MVDNRHKDEKSLVNPAAMNALFPVITEQTKAGQSVQF